MRELKWLKSSFSEASGNNCVEVAATNDGVALRESDSPTEVLVAGRSALLSLIRGVKANAGPSSQSGR
ncbi:DUF397 domain-containing protein [Streptomyces sp. NPDC055144]